MKQPTESVNNPILTPENGSLLTQSGDKPISEQTFRELGIAKIKTFCHVLGFEQQIPAMLDGFNALINPWGEQIIGQTPRWPSDVSYDHTPMEFSVAFEENQPELRLLLEPQGNPTTLQSSWEIGCQINQILESQFNASLERFRQVQDLFVPTDAEATYSMCHAFGLTEKGEPNFKIYLNPMIQGFKQAPIIMQEALHRLGFGNAWHFLTQMGHNSQTEPLVFFSLDLVHYRSARVKIYVAIPNPTIERLELMMSASPEYCLGDAREFCQAMLGSSTKLGNRPAVVYFAFTAENDVRPYSVTLQLPLRDYIENDAIAKERISNFLLAQDRETYERIIKTIADRPLAAGSGLHSFASFKRENGQPRTTLYFALEAYKVQPPRTK